MFYARVDNIAYPLTLHTRKMTERKRIRADAPEDEKLNQYIRTIENYNSQALDGYEPVKIAGSGTFGFVLVVTKDDKKLALKVMHKHDTPGLTSEVHREIENLKIIKTKPHENIIHMEDAFYSTYCTAILLEYSQYSLSQHLVSAQVYLEEGNPLEKLYWQNNIVKFATQLLSGLAHLNRHGIMHRDLKPSNITFDRDREILKIIDFGLSKKYEPTWALTCQVQTLWYRAPELFVSERHYNTSIDAWSLGCILTEMWTLDPLFKSLDKDDIGAEDEFRNNYKVENLNKIFDKIKYPEKKLCCLGCSYPMRGVIAAVKKDKTPKALPFLRTNMPFPLQTVILHLLDPCYETRWTASKAYDSLTRIK